VVGGLSERARKLRQAVSIAVDWEEFISIFANGRGTPGMGPLPPGISATGRTQRATTGGLRLGKREAEAQADRRGAQAPCRSRVSRRA